MRKKIMYVLIGIMFVFPITFFATKDVSAATVDNAIVDRIGFFPGITTYSDIVVFLDDPTDTQWTGTRMFFLSSDLGNQGLAMLLTAISNGQSVLVRIGATEADPPTVNSLITVLYLNK